MLMDMLIWEWSISIGTAMMTSTMFMNMLIKCPGVMFISINTKKLNIPIPIFLICITDMIMNKGIPSIVG